MTGFYIFAPGYKLYINSIESFFKGSIVTQQE
jgi:hypothetical protein